MSERYEQKARWRRTAQGLSPLLGRVSSPDDGRRYLRRYLRVPCRSASIYGSRVEVRVSTAGSRVEVQVSTTIYKYLCLAVTVLFVCVV